MFFGWGNRRATAEDTSAAGPVVRPMSPESPYALQGNGRGPDKNTQMAGEKRDRERVLLEGEVKGEVMVFQPMTILDISIGGAQIETGFALQLDSLHDFRLSLGNRSIIVKGRVVHCHIGELTDVAVYRTGIEFVSLSEHARDAISDFVAITKHLRSHPPVVDGTVDE